MKWRLLTCRLDPFDISRRWQVIDAQVVENQANDQRRDYKIVIDDCNDNYNTAQLQEYLNDIDHNGR